MRTWTLVELERAFRAAWARDTCDDDDLADWCPENPARGQCGVTAMVLWELAGGALMLGEVHVGAARTGMHWWNRLPGGLEIDLTREQFRPDEVVTPGRPVVPPPAGPRRCRGQYLTLRDRVRSTLDLDLDLDLGRDGDGRPAPVR